ncbi:MAG: hypothetical protein Q9208_004349 [Pyrenodesmia sp. 3 TL-2023]
MCVQEGSLQYHHGLGPMYDLATLKQDYPISEAVLKEQQAPVKANFPFDRLPPELQLHVIRFAMPDYGLRPLPLPGLDFPKEDTSLTEYAETLCREQHAPQALFRASKWLSSEAVKIFYNEVKLRIDADPSGFRFMEEAIGNPAAFHSHLILKGFPPFRRQRNMELYIRLDGNTHFRFWEEPALCHYSLKEWLRLIADALSINPRIDSLVVYLPCGCTLSQAEASQAEASQADASQAGASQAGASQAGASQAGAIQAGASEPYPKGLNHSGTDTLEPGASISDSSEYDSDQQPQPDDTTIETFIDFFNFVEPLKRLRVHKKTTFLPYSGLKSGVPCLLPPCQELWQQLQGLLDMEHLSGEKLTKQEKTWKRLKFDVTRKYFGTENALFRQVWRCLDGRDDDLDFEEAVQELRNYLPTRDWK